MYVDENLILYATLLLVNFKNYSFPQQAAYRFEPSNKSKYLLLEIHYDNPKGIQGIGIENN